MGLKNFKNIIPLLRALASIKMLTSRRVNLLNLIQMWPIMTADSDRGEKREEEHEIIVDMKMNLTAGV